jgi:hypothetical protein
VSGIDMVGPHDCVVDENNCWCGRGPLLPMEQRQRILLDPETQEWDEVCCPKCGKVIERINASTVQCATFSGQCVCGFDEEWEWVNPDFDDKYWRAHMKLHRQDQILGLPEGA